MFKKKKPQSKTYDPLSCRPVIRASICTGERTAGFKDLATGKFTDVMLIRTKDDLEEFRRMYDIRGDIETMY